MFRSPRGTAPNKKRHGWSRRTVEGLCLRADGAAALGWLEALGEDALAQYGLVIIDRRQAQPGERRALRRASNSQAMGAR